MSETPERKFDLKAADAARAVEGISEAELRARVRELAKDTDALKRTLANSEANYQRDRADAAEAKLRAVAEVRDEIAVYKGVGIEAVTGSIAAKLTAILEAKG